MSETPQARNKMIREWVDRHDINFGTFDEARAAFEDAEAHASRPMTGDADIDLDQGKKNFKAAKWILASNYDSSDEFVRKAKQIAADFVGMWRKNENQRFELNRLREARERPPEAADERLRAALTGQAKKGEG